MAVTPGKLTIEVTARDRLDQMFYRQRGLQSHLHEGVDPATFPPEKRSEYIRMQILALQAELFEALDEVGWKAWSKDKAKFNREAFLRELVDVQHFLINLAIAADATADEFFDAFKEKNDVNWLRHMAHGYDNSNKCPCGRAMDDYVEALHVEGPDGVMYHGPHCEQLYQARVSAGLRTPKGDQI